MVFAIVLVGAPDCSRSTSRRRYFRGRGVYLFTALALALTGAGRYSIGGRYGPLN